MVMVDLAKVLNEAVRRKNLSKARIQRDTGLSFGVVVKYLEGKDVSEESRRAFERAYLKEEEKEAPPVVEDVEVVEEEPASPFFSKSEVEKLLDPLVRAGWAIERKGNHLHLARHEFQEVVNLKGLDKGGLRSLVPHLLRFSR